MAHRRRAKQPAEGLPKKYSGFEDGDCDKRCNIRRWGERLALQAEFESLALRAVAEHMTPAAYEHFCRAAWERAISRVTVMDQNPPDAGDPPKKEEPPPTGPKN